MGIKLEYFPEHGVSHVDVVLLVNGHAHWGTEAFAVSARIQELVFLLCEVEYVYHVRARIRHQDSSLRVGRYAIWADKTMVLGRAGNDVERTLPKRAMEIHILFR